MTNRNTPNSTQSPTDPLQKTGSLPAPFRVAAALLVPLIGAVLVSSLAGLIRPIDPENGRSANALLLGSAGVISLLIGTAWYGWAGMGLRGKRPLYASIGFAFMGWAAFLVFRFFWVLNLGFGPAGSTQSLVYLFLFEALAVQLWAFGLFFHALADWRGPLTAAIGSGLLFGMAAFLFFEESFYGSLTSLIYFLLWGLLYGIIRLRTGSLLGAVIIQALQSFSAWVVMVPAETPPPEASMQVVYFLSSVAYLIFIWRLWPKEESDYRV